MSLSSEFVALVQQEIPEGRQSLNDSHANLEKVAAYCLENFARVSISMVLCMLFLKSNLYFFFYNMVNIFS